VEPTPEQLQIAAIFFPRALKAQTEVARKSTRFVHYTTADVAFSIIKRGEVWMRNAQVMNDFAEIEYGMKCLNECYNGPTGNSFKAVLESIFPGICGQIEKQFNDWLPHFRSETYLACLSEHLDVEDTTGRLSMWRAYGGSAGIAIVVNNAPFLSTNNRLGAYSSPVEYLTVDQFEKAFSDIVKSLNSGKEIISKFPRMDIVNTVFEMLRYAILCTKHPGFAEEREWRVIHAPTLHGAGKIVPSCETINGIPQSVYKIPLQDWPDEGITGLSIPCFLNRIIIGPATLQGTLYNTFYKLLGEAGVIDIESKLCRSDIPLRR